MKKRELSPGELKKVIELRQVGYNWAAIEREIKVDRRAAKRGYEEWEMDQKTHEQEKARFRVVAIAFQEHLEDLIRLAEALINHLSLPIGPDEARSADQNISSLWQMKRFAGIQPVRHLVSSATTNAEMVQQIQSNERLNSMLFESLQTHMGKVRWQAFNEWKGAWDSCRDLFSKLKIEGRDILNEAPALKEIDESQKEAAVQQMARAMVQAIWASIVEEDMEVKLTDDKIVNTFTKKELDEKVRPLCNDALAKLLKEDTVGSLRTEVQRMRLAINELEKTLSRPVLYPILLYSHCELCPA